MNAVVEKMDTQKLDIINEPGATKPLARLEEFGEQSLAIQRNSSSPLAILQQAVLQGASMDMIEKLMALQERHEANEARKAFDQAMADAKAEIKPILKTKKVDFTSQKGRTNYDYEDLADVSEIADPILSKYGLSTRFRSVQDGSKLTIICIVSHRQGHREETALSAHNDDTGNKNAVQAIGSTATYLQRYTKKIALGLAATKDTDGVSPPSDEPKTIDAEQFRFLKDQIEKAGTTEAKLLWVLQAENLETITQKQFEHAKGVLKKKIANKQAEKTKEPA